MKAGVRNQFSPFMRTFVFKDFGYQAPEFAARVSLTSE